MSARDIAYTLLRKEAAGIIRGSLGAAKGFLQSGSSIAKAMEEAGVRSPTALFAAKASPYAIGAYGGKKAWESEPVQRARYKYQVWKQRRAMEKAMKRQQGGY
jgi:hypothetical protein